MSLAPIFGVAYVLRRAFQEGYLFEVGRAVAVAAVAAVVVICALAFRSKLGEFLPVVVACVAAVEILIFVTPFWPSEAVERHYPTTPAHEFLAEQAVGDRIATHDLALRRNDDSLRDSNRYWSCVSSANVEGSIGCD